MGDLLATNGKFMGFVLSSEGEKDGKKWQKGKFTFKVGEKDWNFGGFLPWVKKDGTIKKGIQPDKLKQGEEYSISYSTYQTDEMENPSKTAVCFFEPKAQGTNNFTQKEGRAMDPSCQISLPTEEEVKDMADMYKQQVDEKVKSSNHFIGTVLKTQNKDKLKYIDQVYKELVE